MVCISQLLAEKKDSLDGLENNQYPDPDRLSKISDLKKQISSLERELSSHG